MAWTADERMFLQTHAAAMVACMVGWVVCALFASVAFNWTIYYLLGLSVTARDVVRTRGTGLRQGEDAGVQEASAA